MLSVSRVIVGRAVPHPTGDVRLDEKKEKALRRKYVLKALELLQTEISKPIVAVVES